MKEALDQTAAEVLEFIEAYAAKEKYTPTLKEIAEHFSSRKPGGYGKDWARKVAARLVAHGRITIRPRVWRGIVIAKSSPKKRK